MGAQRPVRRLEHKTRKMRTEIELSPWWDSRNHSQGDIIGMVWATAILPGPVVGLTSSTLPILFIRFSRFTTKIIGCDYGWVEKGPNS